MARDVKCYRVDKPVDLLQRRSMDYSELNNRGQACCDREEYRVCNSLPKSRVDQTGLGRGSEHLHSLGMHQTASALEILGNNIS